MIAGGKGIYHQVLSPSERANFRVDHSGVAVASMDTWAFVIVRRD